jgi:hypothetical protein
MPPKAKLVIKKSQNTKNKQNQNKIHQLRFSDLHKRYMKKKSPKVMPFIRFGLNQWTENK